MTQWIMVCSCNELRAEADQETTSSSICQKCGKRVVEGRKGSFTQWILRSDICDCDFPIPIVKEEQAPDDISQEDTLVLPEEPELEVDPEKFPLDRFRPTRELGAGATSIVYLAKDRLLSKQVAIKCLLDVNPDLTVRFQKEARLNTLMKHPNIVQVMDVGVTSGGTPFMVIEYFDAQSLADLTSYNALKEEEDILDIFQKILNGVEYAHSKNILHHDLKPDNILVKASEDREWQVKIIDFGYALGQVGQKGELETDDNLLVGSPHFMAPDQAKGGVYDQRSEIYSLGCLFYYLLTGTPPYSGDTSLDILNKHASEPLPVLEADKLSEPLVETLQPVINRCLAKDPQERYPDVSNLKADLEKRLKEAALTVQEESQIPEEPELKKSTAWKPIATASGVIVLICLASFYFSNQLFRKTPGDSKIESVHKDGVEPANISSVMSTNKDLANSGTVFRKDKNGEMAPVNMAMVKDEDLKRIKSKTISSLNLTACPINGSGFKYLEGKTINNLRLNSTDIINENLKYLTAVDGLTSLHLTATRVSTEGLKNLDGLDLRRLFLYSATRINDDAIEVIVEQFPELRKLSIGDCMVTMKGIKKLTRLKKLRNLNINSEYLNDKNIEVLADLPLDRLILGDLPLTNRGLQKLSNFERLRSLQLENCRKVNKRGIRALRKKKRRLRIKVANTRSPMKMLKNMSDSATEQMLQHME